MAKPDDGALGAMAILESNTAAKEAADKKKPGLFKRVNGMLSTAQEVSNNVNEFYTNWIKPTYDNRAQISRRLNGIFTAVSFISFLIYVPFLLFSKIANGLAMGWEVALYACVGVYAVTLITLLLVTVLSGKSTSTDMAKRRRKALKVVLFIVRVASVAIAITALVITKMSNTESKLSTALSTVGIIFSIVSLVFGALPLVTGGFGRFFKWLISPTKIKRTVSFIALEWYELVTSGRGVTGVKSVDKKYFESVGRTIDEYILPMFGSRYAKAISPEEISAMLLAQPESSRDLTEAVLASIFDYALGCNYVQSNPCLELGMSDDIKAAVTGSTQSESKVKSFFRNFFSKKDSKDNQNNA